MGIGSWSFEQRFLKHTLQNAMGGGAETTVIHGRELDLDYVFGSKVIATAKVLAKLEWHDDHLLATFEIKPGKFTTAGVANGLHISDKQMGVIAGMHHRMGSCDIEVGMEIPTNTIEVRLPFVTDRY